MNAPVATDNSLSVSPRGSWLTQTWALVVDAYRELNNKKLFWITLLLSLLVVVSFAFVGINERGIKVFGSEFPGVWNTSLIPEATFYKFIFTQIAIPWWLGLIAAVLALISVCGVFPDFISGGSIDLYLSKPIGRLRLFLTKYVTSLLFVALQVLVFSTAAFLLIGIKSGAWEFGIFLAVPLVTLFFSYLFCVCVLLGVVTRSPLASLLVTILFWLGLFSVTSTEQVLLVFKASTQETVEQHQKIVADIERFIARNNEIAPNSTTANSGWQTQLTNAQSNLADAQKTADQIAWWHTLMWRVRAPLPKTGETVELMSRWLVEPEPLMRAQQESSQRREARRDARRAERAARDAGNRADPRPSGDAIPGGPVATEPTAQPPPARRVNVEPDDPAVVERVQNEVNARTAAWIIGSSLAFEAVVLAIAAWIFCRRDF